MNIKYIVISRSRLATNCKLVPRRQVSITGYKNSQSVKLIVIHDVAKQGIALH